MIVQKVEQTTARHSKKCHTKDKLIASALGPPCMDHILTEDVVFEHIYLHLIPACFLRPKEVENLKAHSKLFHHSHTMLHCAQHKIICKPIRHRLRFTTFHTQGTQTAVHIHLRHTPHAHAVDHPVANMQLHHHMQRSRSNPTIVLRRSAPRSTEPTQTHHASP